MCSNKKDEVCHSFVVEIFTKSLHRGGVIKQPFDAESAERILKVIYCEKTKTKFYNYCIMHCVTFFFLQAFLPRQINQAKPIKKRQRIQIKLTLFHQRKPDLPTVPIDRILSVKNVGAWVLMDFKY